VICWGDGSVQKLTSVNEVTKAFSVSHHYSGGGIFSITVKVIDKDGGKATSSTTAFVSGVQIVDGTLYIIGTNADDRVSIDARLKEHVLRVDTEFQRNLKSGKQASYTFSLSQVSQIVVFTGSGHDQVLIAPDVNLPVIRPNDTANFALAASVNYH